MSPLKPGWRQGGPPGCGRGRGPPGSKRGPRARGPIRSGRAAGGTGGSRRLEAGGHLSCWRGQAGIFWPPARHPQRGLRGVAAHRPSPDGTEGPGPLSPSPGFSCPPRQPGSSRPSSDRFPRRAPQAFCGRGARGGCVPGPNSPAAARGFRLVGSVPQGLGKDVDQAPPGLGALPPGPPCPPGPWRCRPEAGHAAESSQRTSAPALGIYPPAPRLPPRAAPRGSAAAWAPPWAGRPGSPPAGAGPAPTVPAAPSGRSGASSPSLPSAGSTGTGLGQGPAENGQGLHLKK